MEYVSEKVIKGIEVSDGKITRSYVINRLSGKKIEQNGAECGVSYFVKVGSMRKKAYFDSNQMQVEKIDGSGLTLGITHGGVDWKISVCFDPDAKSGVLRKTLKLKVSNPQIIIDYVQLDGFDVSDAGFVWSIPKAKERVYIPAYITTMGQPYYVNDMFMGGEFPMADNRIENCFAYSRYYLGRSFDEISKDGEYMSVPFVMGSGERAEFYSMRRDFFEYLSTVSAQPAKFRIQFNSWYDNMLDIDSDRIEKSFRAIADGFSKAGLRPLDAYVVDDGWIDYTAPKFWAFDAKKFPDEFNRESKLTEELGSAFGVWFGPRGGYTSQTPKYAKLLSSIGYNRCRQSADICTCDPKYIKDLCAKMADFCARYNVGYFKIDGFAATPCKSSKHSHPKGVGDGLYFYTYLWEEWTKGFEAIRKVKPDVFLNVTSYAHCSPWFLKWCDAVWLNNCGDMGYVGGGDNLSQCLNYRDGKYRDFFEERQLQFPASNIYNHEPCYALRNCNPALRGNMREPDDAHPTVKYDLEQFRQYLYMCMMRGSGFVELYFSPQMFDGERYKVASEVLSWAESNFDVIKRSRFFGGAPEEDNVYGYYAKGEDRAILAVRNSSDKAKEYVFDEDLLGFGESKFKVEQFYPKADGESVGAQGGFEVKLAPYEIKLFDLSLKKRINANKTY